MKGVSNMAKVPKVNIKSRAMLPKYSDEELTALAERIGLTLPLLKELHACGHAVYQYIGYDLAEANGGKCMRRAALVEIVLDASYIETNTKPSPALAEWLKGKSLKHKLGWIYEAMAAGFPYAEYE